MKQRGKKLKLFLILIKVEYNLDSSFLSEMAKMNIEKLGRVKEGNVYSEKHFKREEV